MDGAERNEHLESIAREGHSLIEGVIEPAHADALAEDLERLERELAVEPARNAFDALQNIVVVISEFGALG